jgi:hypothetical protein
MKEYWRGHREYYKKKNRDWQRKHRVRNKKTYDVLQGNKAPFPEDKKCQVCGKIPDYQLQYHHFDDDNLNQGIWVCKSCHKKIHNALKKGANNE